MLPGWKNLVPLYFLILASGAVAQDILPDTITQRVAACFACHGKEGRAASDGFYPRIAGKPAGYLFNQLINFREGRRTYPLMMYMVDHQSDAYLRIRHHRLSECRKQYWSAEKRWSWPGIRPRLFLHALPVMAMQ